MKHIQKSMLVASALWVGLATVQAQSIEDGTRALNSFQYEKAANIFRANIASGKKPQAYYELSKVYLNTYKDDSAKYIIEEGLGKAPEEPYLFVGKGLLSLVKKDEADAKVQFEKALTLSKRKDAFVMKEIADAYVFTYEASHTADRYTYAMTIIDLALTKRRGDANLKITKGDLLLTTGKPGDGILLYKEVMRGQANNPQAPYKVGKVYAQVGNYGGAIEYLDIALKVDKNFAPAFLAKAEIYGNADAFGTDSLDKAVAAYKEYVVLQSRSLSEVTRFGLFLYSKGRFVEAESEFADIVSRDRENKLAYKYLALSQYSNGKYAESKRNFDTYFAKNAGTPADINERAYFGLVLERTGSYTEAINELEAVMAGDTNTLSLYDPLIRSYDSTQQYVKAAEWTEAKMARYAKYGASDKGQYMTIATYYFNAKEYAKADTAFVRFLEAYGDQPQYAAGAHIYRSLIYKSFDPEYKTGVATPHFKKLLETSEGEKETYAQFRFMAYQYMGLVAYNTDKKEEAKANLTKALELDPTDATAKQILEYYKKVEAQKRPAPARRGGRR